MNLENYGYLKGGTLFFSQPLHRDAITADRQQLQRGNRLLSVSKVGEMRGIVDPKINARVKRIPPPSLKLNNQICYTALRPTK
jgi:hypothetical protein